jgi:ribosomal protein S18 acetylase RimI-like enzyme
MLEGDVDVVAEVWHSAGQKAYTFIETWMSFSLDHATRVLRDSIAVECDVWVAEIDGVIVGYMALKGSYLDRLYVSPSSQRHGVGTSLFSHAMKLSPTGLELHTHQKNLPACSFYKKHGLVAVAYGVSPPPESEPDVEFHWRPPRAE